MSHNYVISILGLGKLGSAIESQLRGCEVVGWDPMICGNYDIKCDTLYDSIHDADAIFIAVPSDCFEDLVKQIIMEYAEHKQWHSATKVKIISFTKGFCKGRLPIEVLKRELPFNPVGVISGPMLSEELRTKHTHAMLASDNMDVYQISAIRTHMSTLHLHETTDVTGVTLCGIMKNVYAVGMGMADGAHFGENMKACLATKALQEMEYFAGCTISSYAGVGDFLTTCYSSKSRNYTYGYKWTIGEDVSSIMSEGIKNIDELIRYSPVHLPIVNAIKCCLESGDVDSLEKICIAHCSVWDHL